MFFLRAIGFSDINNPEELENLLSKVINNSDRHSAVSIDKEIAVMEYLKLFGDGIGLYTRGKTTENDELIVERWAIYADTSNEIPIINTDIDNDENTDILVTCEDKENGNELAFYLQNVNEFLAVKNEEISISGVCLSAVSVKGKIILPISKNNDEVIIEQKEEEAFKNLIKASQNGDELALETLALQLSQCKDSIVSRLDNNEDLFSIIDNCLFPVSKDDLEYVILGDIEEVKNITNNVTNEEIICLKLSTLGIKLNLYINSKDLTGMPLPNMRFSGTCYISGKLNFLNNKF